VDRTVAAVERLLVRHESDRRLGAVYVTGGGSELPLVARILKETFGRRVKRSPYTRSATAIGLAIQADQQAGYVLRESFTRHFGVWREAEAGRTMTFDPLFEKGTSLPGPAEEALSISRVYSPVHNIGHFRYLECSRRDDSGRPVGDITVWDEILFPFDPSLQDEADLTSFAVEQSPAAHGHSIEERYECDASGSVTVLIANTTAGYERRYRLGRWAGKESSVVPGRRKRAAAKR
jgi:molecular chaperone DnaK (HSP70)